MKKTKSALISAVLALALCFTMLVGTTFAWFTDSVTSADNIIKSGTLEITLEKWDVKSGAWVNAESGPIFNYDKWEPGYTEVVNLRVINLGTLALKWKAAVVTEGELTELADVINVYVRSDDQKTGEQSVKDYIYALDDRTSFDELVAAGEFKKFTLRQFMENVSVMTTGTLEPEQESYLGIVLQMDTAAGNNYQGMDLGGKFDIQILATQNTSEEDSFGSDYDADASLDFTPVANVNELKRALAMKAPSILLTENCYVDETLNVDYAASINGDGHSIERLAVSAFAADAEATVFAGTVFNVAAGATLTLEDVTLDGGAVWTGEIDPVLLRGTENAGITATGSLIATAGNGCVVLNEGVILQNNDGASAVSLFTRGKGTLTVNGGEIINNSSAGGGAVWGGGDVIINAGKLNGNYGGIGGAIRTVYNGCNVTMNGGEMNHNYSAGDGGAIYSSASASSNTYTLNGGEMAYNYSATTGGAIYAGYKETVKIGGTFKMHDNDCAADIGSAIRFHTDAKLIMTGGEIYNHDDNALYLNNNSASITGGRIEGNFGYSGGVGLTLGNAEIDGVISYDLSTNHNTAYLAAEFGSFKFTVNEADADFANFNFKPAADYTYTEGDEAKLVCMNEGYETFWDEATSTFRLRAIEE